MSAILRLAAPHGQHIASLWRNPTRLAATAPPWLPGLLLALTLTAPAWLSFLHPNLNLWETHDGPVHVVRAHALQQHIASGDWYPRWFAEHYGSYGYPYLNFYAPATYYLTVLLAWLLPMVGIYGGNAVGGCPRVIGYDFRAFMHSPGSSGATGRQPSSPPPSSPMPRIHWLSTLYLRGAIPEVTGAALLVWLLVAAPGSGLLPSKAAVSPHGGCLQVASPQLYCLSIISQPSWVPSLLRRG